MNNQCWGEEAEAPNCSSFSSLLKDKRVFFSSSFAFDFCDKERRAHGEMSDEGRREREMAVLYTRVKYWTPSHIQLL